MDNCPESSTSPLINLHCRPPARPGMGDLGTLLKAEGRAVIPDPYFCPPPPQLRHSRDRAVEQQQVSALTPGSTQGTRIRALVSGLEHGACAVLYKFRCNSHTQGALGVQVAWRNWRGALRRQAVGPCGSGLISGFRRANIIFRVYTFCQVDAMGRY